MSDTEVLLSLYNDKRLELKIFLQTVVTFFSENPILNNPGTPIVHSVKHRFKNADHLIDKLERKKKNGSIVSQDNFFSEVTDLIGVRVLHLYPNQFPTIHSEIMRRVDDKEWFFFEPPKAYTWDPESISFFNNLGISTKQKESYYTSIHYVIKPRKDNPICCEIQVRTLFEEIWGEIDHTINYPHQTKSIACYEQIRVLAKLASAGSRLADAIFNSYEAECGKPLIKS